MKKFLIASVLLSIGLFANIDSRRVAAVQEISAVSPNLVISQFQAGGGTATDEFVEIFNSGPSTVDLKDFVVVYRSQNGITDGMPFGQWTTTTLLQPGQYYLLAAQGSYDGAVAADITWNASMRSMSAGNGGLAIRQGLPDSGAIIDSVGWGSVTNIFPEGSATTAAGDNNSKSRKENGCQDTDNNSSDFETVAPSAPRNSSTTPAPCAGGGTTLFAALNAGPTSVSPGGNTLLLVTVIPATNPPSTGISVAGDLTNIGGSAAQAFFDDGTNGDVTAGDNVYSYLATIPLGTSGGVRSVSAAASDAQGRSAGGSVNITVNAPLLNEDPLILGNPSEATPDIANENNYLMAKPQYTISYNRQKATPNWVAWRLDSSWIGSTPRQDDYRPDQSLPLGWYQVLTEDYSGSGYDRGHMCPSGDRTNSIPNNSATFLMTNFIPQLSANNQGPWEEFESYCRTLASQGNELYIFTGPYGTVGTIAQGRITVPQYTWKVVVVLPNGNNDLQRIRKGTRAFGIIVPNFAPLDINAPWRNFRVTVDQVEALTGYDFFSNVGAVTQLMIERRRDRL